MYIKETSSGLTYNVAQGLTAEEVLAKINLTMAEVTVYTDEQYHATQEYADLMAENVQADSDRDDETAFIDSINLVAPELVSGNTTLAVLYALAPLIDFDSLEIDVKAAVNIYAIHKGLPPRGTVI